MIGYLKGRLLETEPSRALVDVGGVGYEVHIPLSTYYEIQRLEEGGEAALFVHTHVRAEALSLFGFFSQREKELFLKLVAVSGIGPKVALAVLSGMAPGDLTTALAAGDVRRLSTIPGIGKKTAERMVLELKDKVRKLAADLPDAPPDAESDLVLALLNLGYKQAQAERAVARVTADGAEHSFPELLRACLKMLSRA